MEKELLVPFIQATSEIITELTGTKPQPGEVSVIDALTTSLGIVTLVGITGDLEGRVILDMDNSTAQKYSETLLQDNVDINDVELIGSAIGEIINMIAGRALTALTEMGYHLRITPPTTITGDNLNITDKSGKMLVIPFETKLGKIVLNLAVVRSG